MVCDFKELGVWKRAFEFGGEIYKVTTSFPKEEIYGLTSQLRRAVVSISSNIAEGCGRRTSKDFVSFLYNAMGSIREVESQLMFSENLGYIEKSKLDLLVDDLDRLGKMLMNFIKHVSSLEVK
ncbi:MAG: four helix bundle protein [archaeon]